MAEIRWNRTPLSSITIGKVYEVRDGALYDDVPPTAYAYRIKNVEDLNERIGNQYFLKKIIAKLKFIEFKGEA